jgi:hypothetical protein
MSNYLSETQELFHFPYTIFKIVSYQEITKQLFFNDQAYVPKVSPSFSEVANRELRMEEIKSLEVLRVDGPNEFALIEKIK